MKVFPYVPSYALRWDELISASPMGTFLHTRRFLSYHGTRFRDASLVLEDDKGRIVGVFPAAIDPAQEDRVVSHPGITYGGLVHNGSLRGTRMLEALQAIATTYVEYGMRTLRYKAIPYIYHRIPSSDDLYALFRLGAIRHRCDLSATIDLAYRPAPSKGRRYDLKKALRSGVVVEHGDCYFEPFWGVLKENLASKYGVRPVHTLEEIKHLHYLFPEHIELVVGMVKGEVVAGVVLFCTSQVVHTQYIAATPVGHEVAALDAVIEHCIRRSKDWGARYFDFGISNEQEGKVLNEGLYQFKSSFGAGGIMHEFYELALSYGGSNEY